MLENPCPAGASAYVWQEGDTWDSVAARYGVVEADLRRINGGYEGNPVVGEQICVPSARCPNGSLYVVHRGDTFTSIAAAYDIPVARLSAANPFVDPDAIAIGQVLCVPAPAQQEQESAPIEVPVETQSSDTRENGTFIGNLLKSTVQAGESYADLLIKSGLPYLLFKLLNPQLQPGSLQVGQEYCVPESSICEVPAGATRSYQLQEGDTLHSTAQQLGVSVGTLLRANPNLAATDFSAGTVIRY